MSSAASKKTVVSKPSTHAKTHAKTEENVKSTEAKVEEPAVVVSSEPETTSQQVDSSSSEDVPEIIAFVDIPKHLHYWDIKPPKMGNLQNASPLIDIRTGKSIPRIQYGRRFHWESENGSKKKVEGPFKISKGPLEPFDLEKSKSKSKSDTDKKKKTETSGGDFYKNREKDPEYQARLTAHLDSGSSRRKCRINVDTDEDKAIWEMVQKHCDSLIAKHYPSWTEESHLFVVNRTSEMLELLLENNRIKSANEITPSEIVNCRKSYSNSYAASVLGSYSYDDQKTNEKITKYTIETKINVEQYKDVPGCIIQSSPWVPDPNDPTRQVRARMPDGEVISYRDLPFDKPEQYVVTLSFPNIGGKGSDWRLNIMIERMEWFPRKLGDYKRKRTLDDDEDTDAPIITSNHFKKIRSQIDENEGEREQQEDNNRDTSSSKEEEAPIVSTEDGYDPNKF